MTEETPWYCPICHNRFKKADPGLLWGRCPECGSTCTYRGSEERYDLTEAFVRQLSETSSLPVVDLPALDPFPEARAYFSRDECLKLTVLPIRLFGNVLVVATADPRLFERWLAQGSFERIKSVRVRMVLAGVSDIIDAVLRTFG